MTLARFGYLANAVKAPLTYVAVFFILQWLWDFVILGKLHGYVQHLFELTGEGNGCPNVSHFRWLELKVIHAGFPISIMLSSNHLNLNSSKVYYDEILSLLPLISLLYLSIRYSEKNLIDVKAGFNGAGDAGKSSAEFVKMDQKSLTGR